MADVAIRPGSGARRWRGLPGGVSAVVGLVVLAVFILGPLIAMGMWAFAGEWYYPNLTPQQWSLKWWTWVFTHTSVGSAIVLSLEAATLATICSAIICIPAAYAFARFQFRGKQPLMLSFLAANAFPKFGLYVSIATLFYQINFIDTIQGIVVIQMVETVLFMIWIPATAFQNIPRSLEEAARDAGATAVRTFLRITLPMAAPAIGVSLLLGFISALDESQGTLLVGLPNYQTVPLLMYNVVDSYPLPVGGVFSLFLSIPSVIVLIVAQRVLTRGQLIPGTVT